MTRLQKSGAQQMTIYVQNLDASQFELIPWQSNLNAHQFFSSGINFQGRSGNYLPQPPAVDDTQ
jgi:hypothetical protein